MSFIDVADLQPVFEYVAPMVTPTDPSAECPVATNIYWAMRIDGEIGNGGVAQLIWNLHDAFDIETVAAPLAAVGAVEAAEVVRTAFDYVAATPARKKRFFAKGPFGPAKPLVRLTERYDDLAPTVSTLLASYVGEQWDALSFATVRAQIGLDDIRRVDLSTELIDQAIDDADGTAFLKYIAIGLDPNHFDDIGRSLIDRMLGRNDKIPARVNIIEQLVTAGANVHSVDHFADTALTGSVNYGGQSAYLRCLLSLGADIDHVGNFGRTAVFGAAQRVDSLRVLVDEGASLDHVAESGETALGFALAKHAALFDDVDHPFRHELLPPLRAGVDLLIDRHAPLSSAVVTNRRPMERRTEACAAVVDLDLLRRVIALPTFTSAPDITGDGGAWTALHEASRRGSIDAIEILLDAGVRVNATMKHPDQERNVRRGTVPIDVAPEPAIVELLASHGAEPSTREVFDLYVTSRGTDRTALTELFTTTGKLDAVTAAELIESIPPLAGQTISQDDDGNLILFDAAWLGSFETKAAADAVATHLDTFGASTLAL